MSDLLSNPPLDLVKPDYSIYRYTDQIYKIVRFRGRSLLRLGCPEDHKSYDHKLDAALSRARRVCLEIALCNPWKYFCTFTLAKNRKDLQSWSKRFSQWIRDMRKKYDISIPYLLVPEQHQDGSWHMHGLFGDISSLLISFSDLAALGANLPYKLVSGDYYDLPEYSSKFGFCSFAPIKNPVACGFYITKYISKQLQDSAIPVGLHLYYCSNGLLRSSKQGDVYGSASYLDQFLTNHYEFCDTGMTSLKHGCDWTFGLEYMDFQPLEEFSLDQDVDLPCVDEFIDLIQISMEGFL